MAGTIAAFFVRQRKKAAKAIGAAYERRVGKATTISPASGAGDDADRILDELDLSSWASLADDITPDYETGFADGGSQALIELQIADEDMFGVVNQTAADFAKARAAELVGKKWIDGELVDNLDPQWAITDSTRDGLRSKVESALTDGMSPADLRDEIEQSYQFSEARAEMIARTELGFSHVQGAIEAWKLSDLVAGYVWQLGSEHDHEDECDDNDGEYADIGELFPSGDDAPPLHPSCVCALLPVLRNDEEEI